MLESVSRYVSLSVLYFACISNAYKIGNLAVNERQRESHRCCLPTIFFNNWPDAMGCFGGGGSKADHEESKKSKETNKRINAQIQKDKQLYRATHRLLLLGKYFVTTLFGRPVLSAILSK